MNTDILGLLAVLVGGGGSVSAGVISSKIVDWLIKKFPAIEDGKAELVTLTTVAVMGTLAFMAGREFNYELYSDKALAAMIALAWFSSQFVFNAKQRRAEKQRRMDAYPPSADHDKFMATLHDDTLIK